MDRAVFAQDRLWLLDDVGRLSSLGKDEESPTPEFADEPLLDMAVHHGLVHTVGCRKTPWPEWSLSCRGRSGLEEIARVHPAGDELVGIASSSTGLVLVTSLRVLEIGMGGTRETWLSQELSACVGTATVLATSGTIYVGINVGEYGGGLFRIERRTGCVSEILSPELDPLGNPLLEPNADAITGIVDLPWDPDAIAVSTDGYTGKILGVRSRDVSLLFVNEAREDERNFERPILGMTSARGSLWAIGLEGIHRIDSDGHAICVPPPRTKKYGNLEASFELPGLVLIVRGEADHPDVWPFGTTPLLVSR